MTLSNNPTTDPLVQITAYKREAYESEKYPEELGTIDGQIPVPQIGELIEFGWYEKDGRRVDRCHDGGEEEYVSSGEYRVVDVKKHYHDNMRADQDGKVYVIRPEVTVDVIVEPAE